ncbi:hypothetical protein ACKFRU_02200 [Corynebacterium tuberculostearicum]|uniref:hypothetical protein n=1 Tax=Corynebacterium tuberculostearicum TaxID=38304 RepID=UPI0038D1052B
MLRTSVTRKAASVKAGAALAVCMLALTTTACSNSERESDALADAPLKQQTPTATSHQKSMSF